MCSINLNGICAVLVLSFTAASVPRTERSSETRCRRSQNESDLVASHRKSSFESPSRHLKARMGKYLEYNVNHMNYLIPLKQKCKMNQVNTNQYKLKKLRFRHVLPDYGAFPGKLGVALRERKGQVTERAK